jgi:hypothetical protein
MNQHKINLEEVIAHGKVKVEFENNNLCLSTQTQNESFYALDMPLNSYLQIKQKFKLPLRIDVRVKIDVPSFYLVLGRGHVTFGSGFQDNRRIGDIVEPERKNVTAFDNKLEIDTFVDLSVIYDLKFMKILIDGKEKFYSKKEKYIKSPLLDEMNLKGFDLKFAGSKQSILKIESFIVTEFENDELANLRSGQNTDRSMVCLSIDKKAKPDFNECISGLSSELQREVKDMDGYLLAQKKLKIKRKIEGTNQACKISYVSTHGFSYSVHISENIMDHFFWWYMVSNYKNENKYMGRKNDLTNETLEKVAEKSPDIADKVFSYYDECKGCSTNCLVKTIYEYSGKKKAACHGKLIMNMNISTFQNLKFMFSALTEIIE